MGPSGGLEGSGLVRLLKPDTMFYTLALFSGCPEFGVLFSKSHEALEIPVDSLGPVGSKTCMGCGDDCCLGELVFKRTTGYWFWRY